MADLPAPAVPGNGAEHGIGAAPAPPPAPPAPVAAAGSASAPAAFPALDPRLTISYDSARKLFEYYNTMAYTGTSAITVAGLAAATFAMDPTRMKPWPARILLFGIMLLMAWALITASTWAMDRDRVQRRLIALEQELQISVVGKAPVGWGVSFSSAILAVLVGMELVFTALLLMDRS